MRFAQIAGVIATGSMSANAFLLPPAITEVEIASRPVAHKYSKFYIAVDCNGCDVATVDKAGNVDETKLTNTERNRLAFHLSVKEQDQTADHLMINGVQIYPVEPQAEDFGSVLRAQQVVPTVQDGVHIQTARGSPELGYMLSTENKQVDKGLNLVKVHFEVVQVRDKDVTMQALDIHLLETTAGKLEIANVQVVKVDAPKEGACNSAICRFKALIANKLSKLKGCMGKPKHSDPRPNIQVGPAAGSHTRPYFTPVGTSGSVGNTPGHPHPHHKGPHRGHGHRRHGGVARFIRSLAFHVVIPIFLGVAMGIVASLVGVIIGQLAIFLWRALFRRNQQPSEYQKVDQVEAAEGKEDPEALLAPPVYEDAPAYEEAVNEKQ